MISEDEQHLTFEFYTPYIIGETPSNDEPWGIYNTGGSNGLVVTGEADASVAVSVDQGANWHNGGKLLGTVDFTDMVKGHRQYLLRFAAGAKRLENAKLTIRTVCQCNAAILPRLHDGGTEIRFAASNQAVVSAGPNLPQAQAHVVDGKFSSPRVTLELKTPRGEEAIGIHAAAHIQSSNPPSPDVKYGIDYSLDGGKSWLPVVKDWQITRRGDEPADFWSQSLCWGSTKLKQAGGKSVQIRFRNDGGKNIARAEAHLVYRTVRRDSTQVSFVWTDDGGEHADRRTFTTSDLDLGAVWKLPTGRGTVTKWVGLEPVPAQ